LEPLYDLTIGQVITVTTKIRAFVTKTHECRNEFYRVIVTGGLICTILEYLVLNYRHFVMNFTGLS
jgi:hypothetical protein